VSSVDQTSQQQPADSAGERRQRHRAAERREAFAQREEQQNALLPLNANECSP
jgi:hypothetical protein